MPDPRHEHDQKFKTCRRFNEAGHAHALTFSCFRRQPFLTSDRACQWLVDAINLARSQHEFDLWAYVIMPEHVHLLVCPRRNPYEVSKFLATLKQSVTRKSVAYVRQHSPRFLEHMRDDQPTGRQCFRFWQRGGGFDRNVWTESVVLTEIDYLHANPVRRGLCPKPEDWRWSSAADYMQLRRGPLAIDFDSLPRFFRTEI